MKRFINAVYTVLESIARAKAAAHMARCGRHKEAQAIMLAD
jgi:hypothetical protein